MPVCCNYIQVGLYVFFVGVLRVSRAAAALVSLHLFCPVELNCYCIQRTSVKYAAVVRKKPCQFPSGIPTYLILQSPVIWPCFWAAGPTEEQICICADVFLQRNLWRKRFAFASLCSSMLSGSLLWVPEQMKWLNSEWGSMVRRKVSSVM